MFCNHQDNSGGTKCRMVSQSPAVWSAECLEFQSATLLNTMSVQRNLKANGKYSCFKWFCLATIFFRMQTFVKMSFLVERRYKSCLNTEDVLSAMLWMKYVLFDFVWLESCMDKNIIHFFLQGDTCAIIKKRFNISVLSGKGAPNPYLDCNSLRAGQIVFFFKLLLFPLKGVF